MALSDLRTAILTALNTVTDIGKVWDFEPHATMPEDQATYFFDETTPRRAWTITRESTAERNANTLQNAAGHLMVIRGYQVLSGHAASTEKDHQDTIELVCVPLRQAMRTQYGDVATLVWEPQVRIVEPRMFAGVLVHYCEITQRVELHVDIG
jgi:hypothetical protein